MSTKRAALSYDTALIPNRVRLRSGKALEAESVFQTLREKFPQGALAFHQPKSGNPWIELKSDSLVSIAEFLRDDQDHEFISLQVVSGTDFLAKEAVSATAELPAQAAVPGRIEIVYVLFSYAFNTQLTLKVLCDRDHAKVPTLAHLFRSANWYEREIYDVLGVNFEGHPNLKRLLLPPDWVGHPLRKDYIFPEEYNGMKVPL